MWSDRRRLWFGLGVSLAVLLGAGLLARRELGAHARARASAAPDRPSRAERGPAEEMRGLVRLGQRRDRVAAEQLIGVFARSANDAEGLRARALALGGLLSEPRLPLRLAHVLDAVQASRTPPERDPLWPRAVESLAGFWHGKDFDRGRDLMLAESRGVARRLLIESFAELGRSERGNDLDPVQRQHLLTDLIDLYFTDIDPQLKQAIVESVRVLAGNELASVLAGADLGKRSRHALLADYQVKLGAAERALLAPAASAR